MLVSLPPLDSFNGYHNQQHHHHLEIINSNVAEATAGRWQSSVGGDLRRQASEGSFSRKVSPPPPPPSLSALGFFFFGLWGDELIVML